MFNQSDTLEERFWKYVDKKGEDECWNWKGNKAGGHGKIGVYGYLYIGHEGRRSISEYAHQLSYEINIGKIPDGIWVLHKCDNPACVNPNHLFLGTAKVNTDDMVQKGRHYKGIESKLPSSIIAEMLSDFNNVSMSKKELEKKYNCSYVTVRKICRGYLGCIEKRRHTILSNDDIFSIRQQYESKTKKQCELAQDFGVHYSTISLIVNGKRR